MSSHQRYMPQQSSTVGRGRQQYQQPPPPPPPTIKENVETSVVMLEDLLNRMANLEAKLDKIVQFLQSKQNPQIVNTNPPNNNIVNLFE